MSIMLTHPRIRLAAFLAAAFFLPIAVCAHDGHDHGEAPAAPGGRALPRFAAQSEQFEAVGVIDGKRLTLYLDRFGDNAPVKEAQLDLDIGGTKIAVKPRDEGEYEGMLPQEPKPGVTPVTLTVTAGPATDLLAAELDIHEESHAMHEGGAAWKRYLVWIGAVVVALIVLAALVRARTRRQSRIGGAA